MMSKIYVGRATAKRFSSTVWRLCCRVLKSEVE